MTKKLHRLTLTLEPEWIPELDKLKREKFWNNPRSDVLRYLIERGLQEWREETHNHE